MAILYPDAFNRRPAAKFDGLFDWDFLRPAWDYWQTKIEPMDIDACVERFGWKLGFETKEGNAPISNGQRITLESLARDGWHIVVLRAKQADDIHDFDVWHGDHKKHYEGDASRLIEFCHNWFAFASRCRREPIYWRRCTKPDLFEHQMTALEAARFLYFERLSPAERSAFLMEIIQGEEAPF